MSEAIAFSWEPAKRQTLGETVAASLRGAILGGHFKPGQRIAEAQVAQGLGVSRAPVRDALAYLEREGLVERSTNQGAVVATMTQSDLDEICSLREALEALAVQRAIECATDADFDQLADNIRATEAAERPGEAGIRDLEFHEILVRAARHGRLLTSWLSLRSQIQLILVQNNLADPGFIRSTARNHRALLARLRARDEASALGLMAQHMESFRNWALSKWSAEQGSSGSSPSAAALDSERSA
jgi:DNA-binding GntR family transcriptional regulator